MGCRQQLPRESATCTDALPLTAKFITIGGSSKSWIVRVLRSITANRSASASVASQQSSQYVRPCSRVSADTLRSLFDLRRLYWFLWTRLSI
ncbi:hypothetical protein K474DRAFT_411436 [Panus rudis PR-1116 ss-1]|nr:hypothetical protein K474DRAFT_411436 [Panus rudis PR-1116 ss-1]